MRSADEWAIDLLRMPRFSYPFVASIGQSRNAGGFDGIQLHLRPESSPHACSARIRGQRVAICQRIHMALRLDNIRSIPSCLGLLRTEEIWLQPKSWGARRGRIRCNSSDGGPCTAPISTDGMGLGGAPRNYIGFPPGTRSRCGLGSGSASAGFYLLPLRVTGPTPG